MSPSKFDPMHRPVFMDGDLVLGLEGTKNNFAEMFRAKIPNDAFQTKVTRKFPIRPIPPKPFEDFFSQFTVRTYFSRTLCAFNAACSVTDQIDPIDIVFSKYWRDECIYRPFLRMKFWRAILRSLLSLRPCLYTS